MVFSLLLTVWLIHQASGSVPCADLRTGETPRADLRTGETPRAGLRTGETPRSDECISLETTRNTIKLFGCIQLPWTGYLFGLDYSSQIMMAIRVKLCSKQIETQDFLERNEPVEAL